MRTRSSGSCSSRVRAGTALRPASPSASSAGRLPAHVGGLVLQRLGQRRRGGRRLLPHAPQRVGRVPADLRGRVLEVPRQHADRLGGVVPQQDQRARRLLGDRDESVAEAFPQGGHRPLRRRADPPQRLGRLGAHQDAFVPQGVDQRRHGTLPDARQGLHHRVLREVFVRPPHQRAVAQPLDQRRGRLLRLRAEVAQGADGAEPHQRVLVFERLDQRPDGDLRPRHPADRPGRLAAQRDVLALERFEQRGDGRLPDRLEGELGGPADRRVLVPQAPHQRGDGRLGFRPDLAEGPDGVVAHPGVGVLQPVHQGRDPGPDQR
jgi:hypothetical protein